LETKEENLKHTQTNEQTNEQTHK